MAKPNFYLFCVPYIAIDSLLRQKAACKDLKTNEALAID